MKHKSITIWGSYIRRWNTHEHVICSSFATTSVYISVKIHYLLILFIANINNFDCFNMFAEFGPKEYKKIHEQILKWTTEGCKKKETNRMSTRIFFMMRSENKLSRRILQVHPIPYHFHSFQLNGAV